ncbi:MAG: methylenetetrahydrofolate reductase [Actinomycetota bacterium]|nr:methylenetetrahydrofolate reductase [Actinomycetota bacterium]
MSFFGRQKESFADGTYLRQLLLEARFEVIPLKNLDSQLQHLPEGASVSVTASPAKTLEDTWDLCKSLYDRGLKPVPHLAARMVTGRDQLAALVDRLANIGASELFLVGGDAPEPFGPFRDAIELLESILQLDHGLEHIGVTAYPDGHSFISRGALTESLHRKEELLASAGIAGHASTQMCFDAGVIRTWLEEERDAGLSLPVHLGIPGAVDRAKLLSIGTRLGVGASLRFLQKNKSTVARLFAPGGYDPNKLLSPLASDLELLNVRGLHIFTFNQIETTESWRDNAIRSRSA